LAGEDAPLIAAAQAGDLEAFDTLIRRHQDRVYNQAWRLLGDHDEASDLAQEVFVRVFRKLHLYRGDAAFSTWLYRVTHNLAKNRWKQMERQGRSRTISLDAPSPHDDDDRPLDKPDTAPGPRAEAEGREMLGHLQRELLELGFEHRQVLLLRFVENLSYEEIAEALDANLGTVKSRICRARQELRERMGRYLDE
jgi:RNA polymerase sigma-70 factor (ECF subfamily)